MGFRHSTHPSSKAHRPHRSNVTYSCSSPLSSAELWLGLAIILLSFLLFPPAGALLVTSIGTVVITSSGVALAIGSTIGVTLVSHALLSAASGPGSTGAESGSGGGAQEARDSVLRAELVARKLRLNQSSGTTRQVLDSLDMPVEEFISKYRKGSIWARLSSDIRGLTVEEAIQSSATARKLLLDGRFAK